MKILYFAWLRAKIGHAEETISSSDDIRDLHSLIALLKAKGPAYAEAFSDMSVVRTAVNQEHVSDNVPLTEGDEIAFFPPVTGG